MNPRLLIPLFCMLLLTTFFSCVDTAPTKEVQHIDSLNSRAYMYRYRDLDSSCKAASQAYKEVSMYSQGKAEASNNLAFCAFMRMDFFQIQLVWRKIKTGIAMRAFSNKVKRMARL